jgi:hypothetical protein
MNGIFSSTPGTGPISLLVGTHGLLIAQSTLALMANALVNYVLAAYAQATLARFGFQKP